LANLTGRGIYSNLPPPSSDIAAKQENIMSAIDFGFRPTGYFWPHTLATHLLATVKGAVRQRHIRSLIEEDRLGELEDWLAKQSLTETERHATGRIHPMLMGGEYLSDLRKREIEIARISLQSTTGDVISVRAFNGKGPIRYRIVDEYNGETLMGKTTRTSKRPLTLGQLEKFIEGAGAGIGIVRFNIQYGDGDPESCRNFLSATSPFYPELDALYELRFDELAKSLKRDIDEDEDATEGEAALSAQSIQTIERI
jgi:hypothetical protein